MFEFHFNDSEIKELLQKINMEAARQSIKNVPNGAMTAVVGRLQKNIRVFIRPNEGNHVLPHFHVETTDYSGSYTIDSLQKLAGNMPTWLEGIFIPWASKHQNDIQQKWDELRPD